MTQGSPVTADEKARFISVLRDTGSVRYACAAIGRSRSTLNRHRETDSNFAAEWTDAEADYADLLEEEARRRAYEGTERGVYYQGALINTETEYSDTLLLALLKARNRSRFGDTSKLDLTSSDRSMSPNLGDTEMAARIASFMAVAAARQQAAEEGRPGPVEGEDLI